MKYCILLLMVTANLCYGQLSYSIDKKPYKDGDTYIGGDRTIPGDEKIILGNHYADAEGNLLDPLPTVMGGGFTITPNGYYVNHILNKTNYASRIVYIKKADFNGTTSLKDATEVNLEKKKPGKITKDDQCYKNYSLDVLQKGYDNYGIYIDSYFIYVMDEDKVVRTIDIITEGKRIDYKIENNYHYGLYAKDNELTLIKTNLEDGKRESKVITGKYKNYSGGEFIISGNNIYVTSFYGECSYNFMANNLMTKGDGLICATINKADLSVVSESDNSLPEDYQALFKLSDKRVTDPVVITSYHDGKNLWIVTSNQSGFGSTTTVRAPFLIWKMEGDELSVVSTLSGPKSTYPASAMFFKHMDKTYLLYCCEYNYDSYKQTISLMDITDGVEESSGTNTLDLSSEVDFYFGGASDAYITPGGKIIFVGKGKNYASILYVKIDIPK